MNVSNMMNLVTFIPITAIRIYLFGENKNLTLPEATSGISIGLVVDFVIKIIAVLLAILLGIRTRDTGGVFLVSLILIAAVIALVLILVANAEKLAGKIVPWLARLPFISQEQSENILSELVSGLESAGSPGRLLVVLLFSIAAWVLGLGYFYGGLLAMGIDLPVLTMLLAVVTASIFVNPAAPYLPPTYLILLVVPMALVTGVDVEALAAFAIVLYAVSLVVWFGFGSLGLRGLKLNFSDFRKQISESIDQVRSSTEKGDPTTESTE
jgi:hypothetical protein